MKILVGFRYVGAENPITEGLPRFSALVLRSGRTLRVVLFLPARERPRSLACGPAIVDACGSTDVSVWRGKMGPMDLSLGDSRGPVFDPVSLAYGAFLGVRRGFDVAV